jgi:two-component system phosphate regulon response regulator PhoB
MTQPTILVVDDEEDILELVGYNLSRSNYQVRYAATGKEALALTRQVLPDLIVLDLMLPGLDGLDVCKQLKRDPRTAGIPIVMLTAKGEEADVVRGFDLGADDYVTKPFSPRILVARVQAVLRRRQQDAPEDEVLHVHDLVIDPSRHQVMARGRDVQLTSTEFSTLRLLASQPGRVFTRTQIVDRIRGSDYVVSDRTVDVQIVALRRKLGNCGSYIETVRGVGYRCKE